MSPMSRPRRFLPFALLLAAATLLAACGDTTGKECDSDDDCSDGQRCAPIVAGCLSLNDCPGICGDVCTTDGDCEGDETCQQGSGVDFAICRSPTDFGDE